MRIIVDSCMKGKEKREGSCAMSDCKRHIIVTATLSFVDMPFKYRLVNCNNICILDQSNSSSTRILQPQSQGNEFEKTRVKFTVMVKGRTSILQSSCVILVEIAFQFPLNMT